MARCDYYLSLQAGINIMASTYVLRTKGSVPSKFVSRKKARNSGIGMHRSGNYGVIHGEPDHKIDDFMMYSEPDEEEEEDEELEEADEEPNNCDYIALAGIPRHSSHSLYPQRTKRKWSQKYIPVSYNFVDYAIRRSQGLNRLEYQNINEEFGTRHMLTTGMFRERLIPLNRVNKIYCSQWLSHRQIVMGTKCNKLMVYDINNKKMDIIPSLVSSECLRPTDQQGIHAIQINPSKTLLATNAQNSKDIAIYRLPTLDPVCVGEKGHTDWILDLCWLDDEFLVSCSTDGKLALWRIDDQEPEREEGQDYPLYNFITPVKSKKCHSADKMRSVMFNSNLSEIVTLSMNAYIHIWDSNRFYQKMSKKLPHGIDNSCLTRREDCSLYAIGSKSHLTLLDPRTLHHVKKVTARNSACNVKSISFHGDILTIGTGLGCLLFFDMRAGKYVESSMNSRTAQLKSTKGWVNADENFQDIHALDYSPAIYTHCYDWSGIRLFAAGGPLDAQLKGNYAALFC